MTAPTNSHERESESASAQSRTEALAFRWGLGTSCVFWFVISTDWSFRGLIADVVSVQVLLGVSLFFVLKKYSKRSRLAWLPVLFASATPILTLPLFFVLGLFMRLESEHVRQTVHQPDGHWNAIVSVRDRGGWLGADTVHLKLRHDWIPFLERDVAAGSAGRDYSRDHPFWRGAEWSPQGRVGFYTGGSDRREFAAADLPLHVPHVLAWPYSLVKLLYFY
jgi:hypothetical protein